MGLHAVCATNQWKSIESPGYGAGYRYAYEEMGKLMNKLTDVVEAGINVVVTAHCALRKFEQPDEMGAYDRYEMKLQTSQKCSTAGMVKHRSEADRQHFQSIRHVLQAARQRYCRQSRSAVRRIRQPVF